MMITVDGKWFETIDKATEYAEIKSLAVGEGEDPQEEPGAKRHHSLFAPHPGGGEKSRP